MLVQTAERAETPTRTYLKEGEDRFPNTVMEVLERLGELSPKDAYRYLQEAQRVLREIFNDGIKAYKDIPVSFVRENGVQIKNYKDMSFTKNGNHYDQSQHLETNPASSISVCISREFVRNSASAYVTTKRSVEIARDDETEQILGARMVTSRLGTHWIAYTGSIECRFDKNGRPELLHIHKLGSFGAAVRIPTTDIRVSFVNG